VRLARARVKRDEARRLLAEGIDPSENRKIQNAAKIERLGNSFEVVAREWFAKFKPGWAPSHSEKIINRLENDLFPWLGDRPIAEITAPELLLCLRRIEGRGALPPARREHYASITEAPAVAELLRAIDGIRGTFIVQSALKLSPLFFVRPGELRKAKWKEFDLDKREWSYLVTKTKTDHLVPLASQATAILRELHSLTGHLEYVFPGRDPQKSMSGAAINAALRRMGYDTKTEITGHGFRAMARTILHQEIGIAPEIIEHQLAHRVPDSLGTAYNRTKFIKERGKMMQQWADYLDKLKAGAEVIPLHGNAA